MIDDEVHDDADPALLGLGHQSVEIVQCPELRRDGPVVRDIVAVVGHGRGIDRRKPDEPDPQIGQVVELRDDAGDVTDPVAVAVAETARIDLVAGGALPPTGPRA